MAPDSLLGNHATGIATMLIESPYYTASAQQLITTPGAALARRNSLFCNNPCFLRLAALLPEKLCEIAITRK